MARRSIVELVIQAQDKASQKIDGVSKSAGGLGKAGAAAAIGVGALGAAFAALQTSGAVVDMVKAADSAQRLETSFERLSMSAESSASDMLGAMKRMSGGAISESDLILAANRAMMLGVANSADEMAGLLEVAAERGAAMGLTTAQAFSDLVTGIGRASPLILDNLGIVFDSEKVYAEYAAQLGKTADELTNAEQKQALLNQTLLESDGNLDTAISSFEVLAAKSEELEVALGRVFSGPVLQGVTILADGVGDLADAIDRVNAGDTTVLGEFGDRLVGDIANQTKGYEALAAEIEKINRLIAESEQRFVAASEAGDWDTVGEAAREIEFLRNNIVTAEQAMQSLSIASGGVLAAVPSQANAAATALDNTTGSITSQIAAWQRLGGAMALTYDIGATFTPEWLSGAESSINSMASGLLGDIGAGGAVSFIEKSTDAVRAQRKEWIDLGYDLETIDNVLLPGYVSSLDDGIRKTTQLGSATEKVSSEYSNLESTVSGILSGAIGPVAGVNAEDFLPREDEINENARRLADIMVNGLTGQDWLAEFAAEAPDVYAALASAGDPQAAAASLLRDFQDGLRPDLIDKDRAKELVKRAILGDQETAALAQEIAGELAAELGVSLQEATAAASSALGVSGGDGGGTGALTEGMVQSVDGGAVVDALVTSIAAKFDSLVTAGSEAGKQWGAGFMAAVGDNVPEPLISLLANLVTPGVMAQLNTNSGLTGADS